MIGDFEQCYRAVQSRDPRFDGWFFTAVRSTGIYCRPSCPARTPRRDNVRFFATAAAAQDAGFRACRRCRPDATPGSPQWNVRADLVGRAMRLIADGVVDRDGVTGLAHRLGYSERHLHRQLVAEVGAGPLALARIQRAQTARILIETTSLPFAQVAFASGFSSIRQFNDTVRSVFACTPSGLRRRSRVRPGPIPDKLSLRLPYRAPCDTHATLAFLSARAVPGVEEADSSVYRRGLALPHGDAVIELAPAAGHVACRLYLEDLRDLGAAVQRCRRLLDLDADPEAVDSHLRTDPLLRPLMASGGRRVPGAVDGQELAIRAVLGQQVSVAAARTVTGRIVALCGKPLTRPHAGVTHLFPGAEALAAVDPAALPLPWARRRTVTRLAQRLASGDVRVDAGVDRSETIARLLEVPGVGPWTASYISMRALADPDAFLPTDLGIRRAVAGLGQRDDPHTIERLSAAWRPWRAYAGQYLWASLSRLPATATAGLQAVG